MKIRHALRQAWLGLTARSSADYWERRYRAGMDSGPGSKGALAGYKAQILNEFVARHAVRSVIEFGCGDGRQLQLATYPRYLGLDVSGQAIDFCADRFRADPSKSFLWYEPTRAIHLANFLRADLTLSLDVIYHLLENGVYDAYLANLFEAADRFVVVYSSDMTDGDTAPHVRHRKFTDDVARRFPEFQLIERVANPHRDMTFADFFFFEKRLSGA